MTKKRASRSVSQAKSPRKSRKVASKGRKVAGRGGKRVGRSHTPSRRTEPGIAGLWSPGQEKRTASRVQPVRYLYCVYTPAPHPTQPEIVGYRILEETPQHWVILQPGEEVGRMVPVYVHKLNRSWFATPEQAVQQIRALLIAARARYQRWLHAVAEQQFAAVQVWVGDHLEGQAAVRLPRFGGTQPFLSQRKPTKRPKRGRF